MEQTSESYRIAWLSGVNMIEQMEVALKISVEIRIPANRISSTIHDKMGNADGRKRQSAMLNLLVLV